MVPLTPVTAVARFWAVMDFVLPPGEDQGPLAPGVPAEHPDIEIASPADSHTGMLSAYQGGKILLVKFGLCQLLDRLDELLASDEAATTRAAPVPK